MGDKSLFLLVTGASKGLGEEITRQLVSHFSTTHVIHALITARSKEKLEHLAKSLASTSVNFEVVTASLSEQNGIDSVCNAIRKVAAKGPFDQAILIHNAGSLGDATKLAGDLYPSDAAMVNDYLQFNFTSMVALTGVWLRSLAGTQTKIIVNISSLLAICPFKGLSLYGAGKAARDSYIRSIAEEYPDVLTLNYAPGPLKTDMADSLATSSHLTEFFSNANNLIHPRDTTKKLLDVLDRLMAKKIKSGSHVDFFDKE